MSPVATDNRRKKFYVDWGINPAYVLALVSAMVTAMVWAGTVNTEIAQGKTETRALKETVTENERRSREDMKEIREGLKALLERRK